MITAQSISVGYGNRQVLRQIDLHLHEGEVCALIGANGSGKSTLLRALAGLHPVQGGSVLLSGQPMTGLSRRAIARKIAVLTQSPTGPEGVSVAQLVAHGLFARQGLFGRSIHRHDRQQAIEQALIRTGMLDHADRPFTALSGGEQQRVWIALTLAQSPRMLLLDEPTSFLDMGHQLETLDLLRRLQRADGIGVVMVLHDINQASFFADRIIALKDGGVVADGPPAQVMTANLVETLYGAHVTVLHDATGRHPYCIPQGRLGDDRFDHTRVTKQT